MGHTSTRQVLRVTGQGQESRSGVKGQESQVKGHGSSQWSRVSAQGS